MHSLDILRVVLVLFHNPFRYVQLLGRSSPQHLRAHFAPFLLPKVLPPAPSGTNSMCPRSCAMHSSLHIACVSLFYAPYAPLHIACVLANLPHSPLLGTSLSTHNTCTPCSVPRMSHYTLHVCRAICHSYTCRGLPLLHMLCVTGEGRGSGPFSRVFGPEVGIFPGFRPEKGVFWAGGRPFPRVPARFPGFSGRR